MSNLINSAKFNNFKFCHNTKPRTKTSKPINQPKNYNKWFWTSSITTENLHTKDITKNKQIPPTHNHISYNLMIKVLCLHLPGEDLRFPIRYNNDLIKMKTSNLIQWTPSILNCVLPARWMDIMLGLGRVESEWVKRTNVSDGQSSRLHCYNFIEDKEEISKNSKKKNLYILKKKCLASHVRVEG